ncbi:MAG: alpha/beta hydrolase [Planctomycetota bacterium]
MAVMRVNFFAGSLQKAHHMTVLLPQDAEEGGPYPVLYLLHGLSDDDTIWTRRTSLERYVGGLPLMVVMPDGGRGFYSDAAAGPAWERHIMEDVIGFVERFFPARADRQGRVIGGLSMGGYGSVKLGLKYPDRFCSVASHSGAFRMSRRVEEGDRTDEMRRIFGENPAGGADDPFALAERIDRDRLPAISLDCGTDDFLIEENRAFHRHLERLGVPHRYEEFPGEHEWGYWDRRIRQALRFHTDALGIKPPD